MGCNYKNWAVTIKNTPNMKLVYKILFMDFENLKFSLLFRGEQGINWAVVAHLAQDRYPAQILIFFKMKMASPAICFFEEYPGKVNLLFSAPLGCKSFLRGMH